MKGVGSTRSATLRGGERRRGGTTSSTSIPSFPDDDDEEVVAAAASRRALLPFGGVPTLPDDWLGAKAPATTTMAAVSVSIIDVMPALIINGCCINYIDASNGISYRRATASMMKNEGEPTVRSLERTSIYTRFQAKLQHDHIDIWF